MASNPHRSGTVREVIPFDQCPEDESSGSSNNSYFVYLNDRSPSSKIRILKEQNIDLQAKYDQLEDNNLEIIPELERLE
jgi:hypothetical protein